MDVLDPSFGLTLWHVLALFTLGAALLQEWRVALAGSILLANWFVCTNYVPQPDASGTPVWEAYALIDSFSAAVIIFIAHNRAILIIALLLIATMFAHMAVGVILWGKDAAPLSLPNQIAYWNCTHWAAWLEAWALAFLVGRRARDIVHSRLDSIGHGYPVDPCLEALGRFGESEAKELAASRKVAE